MGVLGLSLEAPVDSGIWVETSAQVEAQAIVDGKQSADRAQRGIQSAVAPGQDPISRGLAEMASAVPACLPCPCGLRFPTRCHVQR